MSKLVNELMCKVSLAAMARKLVDGNGVDPDHIDVGEFEVQEPDHYCGILFTKHGEGKHIILACNDNGLPVELNAQWMPFTLSITKGLMHKAIKDAPTQVRAHLHTELFNEFSKLCSMETVAEIDEYFKQEMAAVEDARKELEKELSQEEQHGQTRH